MKLSRRTRCKKIVSICPHCVRTIQEDWKEYGTPPEIEHHSEFLARYADRLPNQNNSNTAKPKKSSITIPATWAVIATSTRSRARSFQLAGEVVEAPRSHERSFCCGAGGGLVFLGEETGDRVSHTRAKELVATGAHHCRHRLSLLQHDVPRRARGNRRRRAAAYSTLPNSLRVALPQDGMKLNQEYLRMKIIVAIKQVPERDAQVRIDGSGKWIEEADLQFAMNESDAYALEEALQLKEKHGGEVVVISAGPERTGTTIREALAKGADRAIHVDCDDLGQRDALGVARLLAAAVKPESPDLVLTGLQSDDLGYGQTGVIMAELLGLPHASLILHVEKTDAGLKVKRELEEGWFQNIEMPLPAVLTIQSGGNKLRYATLMGIKKAKTKEVRRVTPPISAPRVRLPLRLESIYIAAEAKIHADSRRAPPKKLRRHWLRS